jgi:hypothetical protein
LPAQHQNLVAVGPRSRRAPTCSGPKGPLGGGARPAKVRAQRLARPCAATDARGRSARLRCQEADTVPYFYRESSGAALPSKGAGICATRHSKNTDYKQEKIARLQRHGNPYRCCAVQRSRQTWPAEKAEKDCSGSGSAEVRWNEHAERGDFRQVTSRGEG